jgi:hypothetical protein
MAPRSLSHISEASKDRDSWAITQKFGTSHGPKTPHSVCVNVTDVSVAFKDNI